MLVLVGLKPMHRHEAELLDRALERRHAERLATILLAPNMPQELAAEFGEVDPGNGCWDRIFGRMYERSLVAL